MTGRKWDLLNFTKSIERREASDFTEKATGSICLETSLNSKQGEKFGEYFIGNPIDIREQLQYIENHLVSVDTRLKIFIIIIVRS